MRLIQRLRSRVFPESKKQTLVWGPTPLVNNKYWSEAVKRAGERSVTLVTHHYPSFDRSDFDVYYDDLVPKWIKSPKLKNVARVLAPLWFILRNASVLHTSFLGGPLGGTRFWKLEAPLLRWAGVRTVLIPFGGDIWMYSRIPDASVRHALNYNYPQAGRNERDVAERVEYWTRHADAVVASGFIGTTMLGRWDVLSLSSLSIDLASWKPRTSISDADGKRGVVRVVHTPNHRLYKGTEFIVDAVDKLRGEGLAVELNLLEGVSNAVVRQTMQEADILVEQLVTTGHGLSAIEGMACGLPVMSNLDNDAALNVFRRYGFLNECPIVSTTPETILTNLRSLVVNPQLRSELGKCSRRYTENYHSYEVAQYMFGAIYKSFRTGEPMNLGKLFHPLESEFMRSKSKVGHPLERNRLPSRYVVN